MSIKRIKKESFLAEKNIEKYKFNFLEVIIIMIITAICAITITIKVTFAVNKTSQKIKTEAELSDFIDLYNSIKKEYYEEVDKEKLVAAAMDGMLGILDDPYTTLLSESEAENLSKELDGEYIGIGAEIASYTDGRFVVNNVYENSPAWNAGIKKNDILLKINNDDITGEKISDISSKLKGKNGTKISLSIKRNEEELNTDIVIGKVEIQSVTYDLVKKDDNNIAVIKISTFAKNSFKQLKKITEKFEKDNISGIIIDLRDNTGGHLAVAKSVAELFLNKNDIIYKLSSRSGISEIKNEKERAINKKIVILVNGKTASASEILTATLKENLNSEVVGLKTYGKGKVQKIQQLSNGTTVKYTIQNWLTPSGKEIDKNGINPTVEVKLSDEYKKNPKLENDNQYLKALELICSKK